MISREALEDIARGIVEAKGEHLFLVDVQLSPVKTGQKVIVYVDGDEGVSIDACAEISRAIAGVLEEGDMMEGAYTLEVSSPGLDQPLKSVRQYRKNIGRNLKVMLQDNQVVKGRLLRVEEAAIVLEEAAGKGKKQKETQERQIAFDHIKKTNVLASFK